jgi:hypothetical protein
MEILITVVIGLFLLYDWITDRKEKTPYKPKSTPPKPKPNPVDVDYNIDGHFGYSPELIKLNRFKAMKTDYLASVQWSHKRQAVLARDGHKCTNCGSTTKLNVHHLSYAEVPNEPISSLLLLCEVCHTDLHETVGYPKVYQDYMEKSYLPPW